MKKRLSIDIETFSRCDLKKAGAAVYGEHGSTQILCAMYAVDDGPVEAWLPGQDIAPHWASHPDEYTFCAWNAAFEWSVMTHHGYTSWVKFPPLDEWDDTMLRAGAMSLPMSLDACAKAMGLSITKDADGYAVMMKLCKPNAKGDQITYDSPAMTFKGEKKTGAELFEMLYAYCENDVEVERMIAGKIPQLSDHERQVCEVNARINQRGVYINSQEIQKIINYYEPEAETLKTAMKAATGLDNPNSNTQFHQWLLAHGVDVPNVQAATMAEVHDGPDTPYEVRHAVSLRMALQRKATDKYTGMLAMATADSRVRHVHTYHGAHTGRFASRGINLQNMHRPTFGDVDACIESLALPEWVDMLWGAPTDVWGSRTEVACTLTRSAIQAAPGNVLLVSDYSAIEARVLAWLAGMADTIEVFTTHGELYEHTAAGIYRKPIADVDKEERFIGKVACLALGYGGSKGAFLQMARQYGVKELDMDITGEIVQPWRAANPMAVKFWHEIERAAKRAIRDPGSVHEYRGIRCKHARGALRIRLPSGRCLHYWGAWLGEGRYGEEIKFWGVDSKTRRWGRMSTYGGKLTENIVQAIARDILAFALVNLEAADFPVVLHVHDEIVAEVPESRADELAEMERIMCRLPDWAEGLPLAAEGGVMKRYQKT